MVGKTNEDERTTCSPFPLCLFLARDTKLVTRTSAGKMFLVTAWWFRSTFSKLFYKKRRKKERKKNTREIGTIDSNDDFSYALCISVEVEQKFIRRSGGQERIIIIGAVPWSPLFLAQIETKEQNDGLSLVANRGNHHFSFSPLSRARIPFLSPAVRGGRVEIIVGSKQRGSVTANYSPSWLLSSRSHTL